MEKTIAEYKQAVRLRRMNQELYDHLLGSITWLLKYSEKYNVRLPQQEALYGLLKRAEFLIDETNSISKNPAV